MHDSPISGFRKTSMIAIDSRSRSNGDISNFWVQLHNGYGGIKGLKLQSAEIMHSFFAINNSNNAFQFIEDPDPTVFNLLIPPGNYTLASLSTAIGTLLTTTSPGGITYTVAIDPTTYYMTITPAPLATFTIQFLNLVGSAYVAFGALEDSINIATLSAMGFTNSVSIGGENYLFIRLNAPTNNDGSTSFNYKVPVISGANTLIAYTNNTEWDQVNYFGDESPLVINTLRVELIYWDGSYVDMNGVDWSFTLTVFQ